MGSEHPPMPATIYLDEAVKGEGSTFDCSRVRIMGDVVWATVAETDRQLVVPLGNVAGIEGETVDQFVDELPSPGGRYTELVTEID